MPDLLDVFVWTLCLCALMIVGTACYQVVRKTRGKPLTLPPPPPKATADDVRHYPERDEDDE